MNRKFNTLIVFVNIFYVFEDKNGLPLVGLGRQATC